jgi:hypothetical protein
MRSLLSDPAAPLPSIEDEFEHLPEDDTPHDGPTSEQHVFTGAALPDYLDARLDILSGPGVGEPFKVTMVRTVIGRGRSADMRVKDGKMSKVHATIIYTGSEFRIRDEKSTNGTFLNGSRVIEYWIRDGDRVRVGDSLLQFRFGAKP